MRRINTCFFFLLFLLSLTTHAWSKDKDSADHFPSDVASVWFDALYDVVKSEATSPPPGSRIYGVTAVALYESIVAGTKKNKSLVDQLNDLKSLPKIKKDKKYHWPTVANAALAQTIRGIFTSLKPENLDAINALETNFNAQFETEVRKKDFARSIERGKKVADAILQWALTDGFDVSNNCLYVPAPVPGAWEPTPPAFNPNPLQPCWGQLRPMALNSGGDCAPPGHPTFDTDPSSSFFAAADEVYQTGIQLTDEQKTIASYWADGPGVTGTPPGHWIAIVGQFARNNPLSLSAAAEAYARLGIAVHDSFIVCWNEKYRTNLQRPVTYIQDHINANWLPFLGTPNFPAYTSGHSSQSGASAVVLTDLFGIQPFTDTTHTDHGLVPPQTPRTFDSLDAAAAEAALSRLYGGIHYAFDNNDGLATGQCVGQAIVKKVKFRR